ncbi:MAG: ASKHA domain-containing protein, partial [Pseudomonadota bacterium]
MASPETHRVVFTPSGKRGDIPAGTNLLDAARQLGVDLDSVCGGRSICGRCQIEAGIGNFSKFGITVKAEDLPPIGEAEERYRNKRGMEEGRRLACQYKVLTDMVVDVPADSQVHQQVIRKRAEAREISIMPIVRPCYIEVAEPDMDHPSGDMERIMTALQDQWDITIGKFGPYILPIVQSALREGNWKVTVAVRDDTELLWIWPGFVPHLFGAAVDVGSTTISVHLTQLDTGEVLTSVGAMNPQIRFGEDLMSRVSYVMMNPGGDKELTAAVRKTLNHLCDNAIHEAGIAQSHVMEMVLVGNPVMHHLVLGLNPVELGWAPFALTTNSALTLRIQDLDIVAINASAYGYFLPCIAGHVGADAAAVVLSEAPEQQEEMTLIVDIGTNAEIIMGNKHKLYACSSPTGPALEGAQISCGQRAAAGAIDRVRIDAETLEARVHVIEVEPWSDEDGFADAITTTGITGLCGSGIIEAIAEMFLAGILDEDGNIRGELVEKCPLIVPDGRTFSYIIQEENPRIQITQQDIRAIQLAKAALYA